MIRNKFSSRKFKKSPYLRHRFSRSSFDSSSQYKENLSLFEGLNDNLNFFEESSNENLSFDETGKKKNNSVKQ